MKVLVTGATGKIGNSIAWAAGRAGHEVRVLVRDPGRGCFTAAARCRADEGINAQGSANLARAAALAGVRRFVHTSTIDVFDATPGGKFDESALATRPEKTAYERSKQQAERAVQQAADGMEIVFVNPAVTYGPGSTASPSVDRMFSLLLRGLFPAVPPGGFGVVFTEGLAHGHLLAAE